MFQSSAPPNRRSLRCAHILSASFLRLRQRPSPTRPSAKPTSSASAMTTPWPLSSTNTQNSSRRRNRPARCLRHFLHSLRSSRPAIEPAHLGLQRPASGSRSSRSTRIRKNHRADPAHRFLWRLYHSPQRVPGPVPLLGFVPRPYDFWKDFDVQVSSKDQNLRPFSSSGQPDVLCSYEGGCELTGATLQFDFNAEDFASGSAVIDVIPPEGDPLSVDFDLGHLR